MSPHTLAEKFFFHVVYLVETERFTSYLPKYTQARSK